VTEKPRLVGITMVRETLDDIPEFALPPGHSFRLYTEGDEKTFDDVWLDADALGQAEPGLFEKEFRANIGAVPERMYFVVGPDGTAIATATAWFNDDFEGARWGVVHWVAVRRAYQGRGLSKPLISRVLSRMKELGHDKAYLITQTARLPAISLYMKFGFEPFIKKAEDAGNWKEVRANLAKAGR
jgi:GNAT superfamily N-acetyltransferase